MHFRIDLRRDAFVCWRQILCMYRRLLSFLPWPTCVPSSSFPFAQQVLAAPRGFHDVFLCCGPFVADNHGWTFWLCILRKVGQDKWLRTRLMLCIECILLATITAAAGHMPRWKSGARATAGHDREMFDFSTRATSTQAIRMINVSYRAVHACNYP